MIVVEMHYGVAEPEKIRHDYSVVTGQDRNHPAVFVPLEPAPVQKNNGIAIALIEISNLPSANA
jgi:hypothetical protein